jgi:hypothetical protein
MGDVLEIYDREGKFVSRIDTRTDAQVIEQNLWRIECSLNNELEKPVDYNGRPLQIRDQDRRNLDGAAASALAVKLGAGTWNPGTIWMMGDNMPLSVPTPDDMLAMGQFAKAAFEALMYRKWTARTAIIQATNSGDRDAADAVVF